MDINEASANLLSALAAKIRKDGGGFCMACAKAIAIPQVGSLALFVPKSPSITGKSRVIAYVVCRSCLTRPHESLAKAVEGNIIREGLLLHAGPTGDTTK